MKHNDSDMFSKLSEEDLVSVLNEFPWHLYEESSIQISLTFVLEINLKTGINKHTIHYDFSTSHAS